MISFKTLLKSIIHNVVVVGMELGVAHLGTKIDSFLESGIFVPPLQRVPIRRS
jgi:hypothetical protein